MVVGNGSNFRHSKCSRWQCRAHSSKTSDSSSSRIPDRRRASIKSPSRATTFVGYVVPLRQNAERLLRINVRSTDSERPFIERSRAPPRDQESAEQRVVVLDS